MKRIHQSLFVFLITLFTACSHEYQYRTSVHQLIPVNSTAAQDSVVRKMIKPYKLGLDSLMTEVICYTELDLTKGMPEGSLGNFVCDELLEYARNKNTMQIDFCMFNNGGLRIPSIQAGPIHTGQIYELLPFENTLEVIELDGASCKYLLDEAAKQGGVPVAGIRFRITQEGASDIMIDGKPFDIQKKYFVLTNDYLANGGEEAMTKAIGRVSLNAKLRDSMILHLREKKANNKTIKTVKDGRIFKI